MLQLLIIRLPPPLPRYASLVIFRRRPPRRYGHFGRFDRDGIVTAATGRRRQGQISPWPRGRIDYDGWGPALPLTKPARPTRRH